MRSNNSLLGDNYTQFDSDGSNSSSFNNHRFNPPSYCAQMFSVEPVSISRRWYNSMLIVISIFAIVILSLSLDIALKPEEYFFPSTSNSASSSSTGASFMSSSQGDYPTTASSTGAFSSLSSSSAASISSAGISSAASISGSSSYRAAVSSSSLPSSFSSSAPVSAATNLSAAITTAAIFETLNALQAIADASFSTRAIGTIGFNRSVDYIYQTLTTRTSIYNVAQQHFVTNAWNLTSPPIVTYSPVSSRRTVTWTRNTEYQIYTFSGSGVTDPVNGANVVLITTPCSASAWSSALNGSIVLIQKITTCSMNTQINYAIANGVLACLFYNQPNVQGIGLIGGLASRPPIAVLSVANVPGEALAAELASGGSVAMILSITGLNFRTYVTNTCATTKFGNMSNVIISGSHLDSVPAGPGINDNGSGTSLNMALALTLDGLINSAAMTPFVNAVRFCWWAAEETGLEGSQYYVQQAVALATSNLASDIGNRIQDIALNLNYDIAGSPNGVFGVWDGDSFNPARMTNFTIRSMNGSLEATRAFEDFYNASSLTYDYRELDSRSDYQSFHDAGVAAGGSTSGRETIKTLEQRNRYAQVIGPGFGGIPGIAYDPCYHQSCDQVYGISPFQVTWVAKAAAAVLEKFARNSNIQTLLYNTPAPYVGNISIAATSYKSHSEYVQEYWSHPENVEALKQRFAESRYNFFQAENGGMMP